MSISTLLTIVDGGPLSERVVRTAIDIGSQLDAETVLMHIAAPPSYVMYPAAELGATQVVAEMISGMENRVAEREQNFDFVIDKLVTSRDLPTHSVGDERCGGFSAAPIKVAAHENREIARRGRLSDMIVMAVPGVDGGGVDSAALESALLDTGRPVLVIPDIDLPAPASRVTIAWDGSRESAVAVRNALPVIKLASEVEVVHVSKKRRNEVDPNDVVRYLANHGIKASSAMLPPQNQKVSDVLVQCARDNGNAILIMGAYGQSAITEYVFGGVTRAILETSKVPLLLSH